MGVNTRGTSGSNKTFINIYQNDLVLEYSSKEDLEKKLDYLGLDKDDIKVRQRTKGKNEGQDVFYYVLSDVSGKLTNISINETDFGEFLELEFTDVDEKFCVSLGDVYSRTSKDFIRRVGNLDLAEEVVFGIWYISPEEADNGKPKSGVKMYQNDTKVEYFISYDELPEPTTKTKGRKTIWNFDDQEEFLYQALMEYKDENFLSEDVSDSDSNDKKEPKKAPAKRGRAKAPKKEEPVNDDLPF